MSKIIGQDKLIKEEKDGYLETVFEDGILKKEYSLEEIRQRIDNGL